MRLKVMKYENTKSTVFSLAVWDMELRHVPDLDRLMTVLDSSASVVDKLHGLLLLANRVESYHATKQRNDNATKGSIPASRQSEADSPEKPVSVQV